MRLDDPLLTEMTFFFSCSPCIFEGNMAFTLIVSRFCYMQEIVSQQHENKDTSTTTVIDDVGAEGPNNCEVVDPMGQFDDDFVLADGNTATSIQQEEESNFVRTLVDRGTQKPMMPYKNQCDRRKREMRADIIETVKSTAMKYVLNVPGDLSDFLKETVNSKKWHSTFGFFGGFSDESTSLNPTLVSLVNKYQESAVREKKPRKKEQNGQIERQNCYWQFLERLQNNTDWGENTGTL